MSETSIFTPGFAARSNYSPILGPYIGPYINTGSTTDLTKTKKEPEYEKKIQFSYDPSAIQEAIDFALTSKEEPDKYTNITNAIVLSGKYQPVFTQTKTGSTETESSGPVYQARKSNYVPYFQSAKSNTTGEAPSYISKSRPSSKSSFTFDVPASYINKKSIEDPFDQSFGFISPSYISSERKTQERIMPTSAPSYISRDRRPQERTQPTQSPSYISKEYLKRASRY